VFQALAFHHNPSPRWQAAAVAIWSAWDNLSTVNMGCTARTASGIIALMQLELFPWETLTASEKKAIIQEIRNGYWYLRHFRSHYQQADRRRIYRRIEGKKKTPATGRR
jgi:predicted Fe-S protein YdhL (DUF1289 family)